MRLDPVATGRAKPVVFGAGAAFRSDPSRAASFTVDPTTPEAGQSATFDANGASSSYAFDSPGDSTVELTLTDDDGATATATRTVTVSEPSDPTDDRHVITFVGNGGSSDYALSVNGEVLSGEGLSGPDEFSGPDASGVVWGGGTDSYAFEGELTALSVSGDATVYVDGTAADPADY